jgi:iron-sulfur cluster assembly protein
MSFLGDAFSIPPAKPKSAAAPDASSSAVATSFAVAPAPPDSSSSTATEELRPEDSAPRTTDAAVNAASAKVNITPPLPGAEPTPNPEAAAAADSQESVVAVTEKAAKEVHRIIEEQKLPGDTGLRLGVQGGGCSGFSYKLAFETVKAPLDWEGTSNGIRIYIDPKSFLYLAGIELDFQDSLMGRGFVFNNPNAKKTCGCGESFTV